MLPLMVCVTTSDMKEGFCEVRECSEKCNINCINNDSNLQNSESIDTNTYNKLKSCDRNNNDVISKTARRKNYTLRFVEYSYLFSVHTYNFFSKVVKFTLTGILVIKQKVLKYFLQFQQ